MAKSEKIYELIKSHVEGDDSRFYSIALQLAANASLKGNKNLAQELKELVLDAKNNSKAFIKREGLSHSLIDVKGELAELLTAEYPETPFAAISVKPYLKDKLASIIYENKQFYKLQEFSLEPKRKLLLYGPPGTGKTMTASILAHELKMPLFTIKLDSLINKFLGETSTNLRKIFNAINSQRGVYFFDEFDALGSKRSSLNDVGEARRILNTILQFIEKDKSESLIVAATNHVELLDHALFRRFHDVIQYELPSNKEIKEIILNCLVNYKHDDLKWKDIYKFAKGLSHAEIALACYNSAKIAVLSNSNEIDNGSFVESLIERKNCSFR